MIKNKFEIVNINNIIITIDISQLISNEELYFNATEIAKYFNKSPKDYLSNKQTQDYINARCRKDNSPFENYVKVQKGGKYQGTWLNRKISIDFARWCSPEFAVNLDDWIMQKLSEEKHRKVERQLAKMEYPQMSLAVQQAHKNPQPYHYSNEADMINRIVLGCTAKIYCEKNNIDRLSLRDNLPIPMIGLINELQKLNTCLIQIHMEFGERKEKLYIRYSEFIQKLLK